MRFLRPGPGADLWLDTEPDALEAVRRHLETYKIGRDVEIEDLSAERAILSLIGPATGPMAGTAPLPPFACETAAVAGLECLVVGTEEGVDLVVAVAERDRLWGALIAAGAVEVDVAAAEILRIEAGRVPDRRHAARSRPAAAPCRACASCPATARRRLQP